MRRALKTDGQNLPKATIQALEISKNLADHYCLERHAKPGVIDNPGP